MKTYLIKYSMDFHFSDLVNHHYFSLKCLPSAHPSQKILSNKIRINADYYSLSKDCFGNTMVYGQKENNHNQLSLYVESKVTVDWTNYDKDDSLLPVYLKQTSITEPEDSLKEYAEELSTTFNGNNSYDKALYFSKEVHKFMFYEKGSTNIKTSATTAFKNRKGVCQDFAHILIGLLRYEKIPCRYVAGVMAGETVTHAWVEFFAENKWNGIDPTNNSLVDDNYVMFSRGRDYHDTLVNKGIFYGTNINQTQNIAISMEEIK